MSDAWRRGVACDAATSAPVEVLKSPVAGAAYPATRATVNAANPVSVPPLTIAVSTTRESGHHQWLDVLRLIAALVVVVTHTRGAVFLDWSGLEAASRNIGVAMFFSATRLGEEAVIVFFVLSGFLVGGRTFEKVQLGLFDEKSYLLDRFTRIWIPLVPALVLSACLAEFSDPVWVWIGNLLGLQGAFVPSLGANAPLWSLAYEIWFYVLAYAIGRQSNRARLDLLSAALIFATLVVFARLKFHYLFCWALGAYFYVKPMNGGLIKSLGGALAICLVGIIGSQARGPLSSALGDFHGARETFDLILAFGAAMLCSQLVRLPPSRYARGLTYLAGFSYTLYLVHAPLLLFISRNYLVRRPAVDVAGLGVFIGLITGFCLVSWLLYLGFERNTVIIRSWLKAKIN
jgi:peptidoglycan/LPS O-acetylase OafA/YrhL